MGYTSASNVSKIVQKYVQPVQKLRRQIDEVFVYHAPPCSNMSNDVNFNYCDFQRDLCARWPIGILDRRREDMVPVPLIIPQV